MALNDGAAGCEADARALARRVNTARERIESHGGEVRIEADAVVHD